MVVLANAALIGGVTLFALAFIGYGPTRLLLPTRFRREAILWMPFVGYTLMSIVCHVLNVDLMDGRTTFAVLGGMSLAVNLLALVFGGRRPLRSLHRAVGLPLFFGGVIAFFLSVGPLLAIGQLTAIAKNYDLIDVYDATAAYILDFPVNAVLRNGPPNPLGHLVVSPATLSNGWGLSYLHAMASLLVGRSAIATQAPVFGLMHALIVPAAYIFFRRSLMLSAAAAAAASVVLGIHGLLLSIAIIGLGNHDAILALLPLVFASTFLALDDPRWQTVTFAGFMLTNIPLTYWAAFPFYVPPVLLYVVWKLRFRLAALACAVYGRARKTAEISSETSDFSQATLSGTCAPADLVRIVQSLSRSHGTGRVAIASGRTSGVLLFREQTVRCATADGQTGLQAADALLRSAPSMSFAFDPRADLAEGGHSLVDGIVSWRALEVAATTAREPQARRSYRKLAGIGVAVIGSLLLALPGYERIAHTILTLASPSQGWGQKTYVDAGLIPGIAYWVYPGPKDLRDIFGGLLGGVLSITEGVALIGCLLLGLLAITTLRARGRQAVASIGIAYLALLLLWHFALPYPYAYFKGMTFSALVGVPLVVVGLMRLWQSRMRLSRPISAAFATCVVGLIVLSTALTSWSYADQRQTVFTGSVLPPSVLSLQQLPTVIPPGATVFVSTTPPMRPEVVSAAAFFLRRNPLVGYVRTLESTLDNVPVGGAVADFGLLAASEDPADHGYEAGNLVWSNDDVKLYTRGHTLAFLAPEGTDQLSFSRDTPLQIHLTNGGIYTGAADIPSAPEQPATRQLVLELGALEAQVVQVKVGSMVHEVHLAAGLSVYSMEAVTTPDEVVLSGSDSSPVFIKSAALRDTASSSPSLERKADVLVAVPTVSMDGNTLHLQLSYAGADLWLPTMAIGLNVGGNVDADGSWNDLGWWGAALTGSDLDLHVDLGSGQATASSHGQDVHVNTSIGHTSNGSYAATLNFWEPTQASTGWRSPFFKLLTIGLHDGMAVGPDVVAPPVVFLSWRVTYDPTPASASYATQVAAIRAGLFPSSRILLGPSLRGQPDLVAALVQGLPEAELYAAYVAGANDPEPSRVYDEAILRPDDDPTYFGYESSDRILLTRDLAVYRRGKVMAHLEVGRDGQYPSIGPNGNFVLYTTATSLSLAPPPLPADTGQQIDLRLSFGSLNATTITITTPDGGDQRVALPDGVAEYSTGNIAAGSSIVISGSEEALSYLLSADLLPPDTSSPGVSAQTDTLLVETHVSTDGVSQVAVDVRSAGGDPSRDFYIGINLNGFASSDGQWFPGAWWATRLVNPMTHVQLDLDSWSASATSDDGPLSLDNELFDRRDGDYNAALNVWEVALAQANHQPPSFPLFEMHTQSGQPVRVLPASDTLKLIRLDPA